MLTVCDDNHDDIVYDSEHGNCPVCDANRTIEELEKDLNDKEEELDKMASQLREAQDQKGEL